MLSCCQIAFVTAARASLQNHGDSVGPLSLTSEMLCRSGSLDVHDLTQQAHEHRHVPAGSLLEHSVLRAALHLLAAAAACRNGQTLAVMLCMLPHVQYQAPKGLPVAP